MITNQGIERAIYFTETTSGMEGWAATLFVLDLLRLADQDLDLQSLPDDPL